MILGSVQPSYLAWIPFFERMYCSDVFVYLDDVEYSKNSFHNRNRIKTPQGPLLLTVPVLYKNSSRAKINEIEINYKDNWQKKHWLSIEQNYKKAKFFDELSPQIKKILFNQWPSLAHLNIALIECLRAYIDIKTPCYRSSAIPVDGVANEKLVALCRHFHAVQFIVKPLTEDYHPKDFFEARGITFHFFQSVSGVYQQGKGAFVGGLSCLDFAFHCGPRSFDSYMKTAMGRESCAG